jgi:Trehalase
MRNIYFVMILCVFYFHGWGQTQDILTTESLKNYTASFNRLDSQETVKNYVPNATAFDWLSANIPLFDCPDGTLQKVYYYRWWAFRKHLKQTPEGFIFTEFITDVKHAGKYNAVSSALGHHINEGRWLRNSVYINDYINFWLYIDSKHTVQRFHGFSSWVAHAIYGRYLINSDTTFLQKNLPTLHTDYQKWETERQLPNGMFYQFDVKDAMEESISGSRKDKNIRPTINSYMYGNAAALAAMAAVVGNDSIQKTYQAKADFLQKSVSDSLWDSSAGFFKVRLAKGGFSDAREAIGFIPWYFNLPKDDTKYSKPWNELIDNKGFKSDWGITTAERRHPLFRTHGSGHGCEWDGPVWPFATTQTLKALSNLLNNYKNIGNMTAQVFYDELHKYAQSQQMNGQIYIGEYQDEKTGEWLKGDNPRSKFYNHSGFADLIINDLIGLKPRADNVLEIRPLVPKNWEWFCIDGIAYHHKKVSIVYDKTGKRYGKKKGFWVLMDGKIVAKTKKVGVIKIKI